MRTIQLKCSDNEIFSVEEALAKQSGIISNLLKDFDADNNILIPLLKVDRRMLRMVMEWWKKHADEKVAEKDLQDWESEFVNLELDAMYELIMAANYLEVDGLLHRLCQRVADIIAGKQPEEIRKIFNIDNDFSPEEEAALRKQNSWALDPKNN